MIRIVPGGFFVTGRRIIVAVSNHCASRRRSLVPACGKHRLTVSAPPDVVDREKEFAVALPGLPAPGMAKD